MKTIYQATLTLLFTALYFAASAQDKSEFKSLGEFPSVIQCTNDQLMNAFDIKEGQQITLSFSSQFGITGKVISNVQKYNNLQVVVIRALNFENTLFKIAKQTLENKDILFSGRIISEGGPEGYRMIADGKGNYLLEKFETRQLVQDCYSQQ